MAPTATVVLSGGAPNSALTAGALCGIYDSNKTFNTFFTSGAGAIFGLLTLAPKGDQQPNVALRNVIKRGIHPDIYKFVPLGYKTFYKSGPFAKAFKRLGDRLKFDEENSEFRQFYNDAVDLWVSAATPTFVNPLSKALCAPFPFVEDFIEFSKLGAFKGNFYMNAYCIDSGKMELFDKEEILKEPEAHFHAALAFPYIYPPEQVGGKHYYEGSAVDPLCLSNLLKLIDRRQISNDEHTIVLIDVLGSLQKKLIRLPRHLIDAYGISIMTPIWSLAEQHLEIFRLRQKLNQGPKVTLERLEFDVHEGLNDILTDWRRDVLEQLFQIGYEAGQKFCRDKGDALPDRAPDGPNPNGGSAQPAVAPAKRARPQHHG